MNKRYIRGTNYALDLSVKTIAKAVVVDQDVISQSIENILMTGFRERVMEPSYGSILPNYIFEKLTPQNADSLLSDVIRLIKKWENRVRVLDNDCRIILNKPAHYIELYIVYYNIAAGTTAAFNKRIVF